MSTSSTSVSADEPQISPVQPTEPQSRLREKIAAIEALDAQLEAASRGRSRRRRCKTHKSAPVSPFDRHRRKCQICRHPDRELIEADFVEWRHPNSIHDDYKVGYFALYRHARATGLLQQRAEHVSIVVQRLLEEVESVEVTSPFAILRGVHILASLNSRGQWTTPTTTHVVVTNPAAQASDPITSSDSASLPDSSAPSSGFKPQTSNLKSQYQYSNRKPYEKLEPVATHTKQTSEATSNRKET